MGNSSSIISTGNPVAQMVSNPFVLRFQMLESSSKDLIICDNLRDLAGKREKDTTARREIRRGAKFI